MGLDDLKLSPYLLQEMYAVSLVDDATLSKPPNKKKQDAKAKPEAAVSMKFLGKNNRNILVLTYDEQHAFLADSDLQFLVTVLNACRVSTDDIALVNCFNNADAVYERLTSEFKPEIVLFFGIGPEQLGFPVQIPRYRIQQYNKQKLICAASLEQLAETKEEKKQLWNVLKVLFEIP